MSTLQLSPSVARPGALVGAERRKRPRLFSRTTGFLLPVEANAFGPEAQGSAAEPWEVRVCDVSRHGVGFQSSEPMQMGEVRRIRIGLGPMNLAKRMRVVNCRPAQDRTYAIGGEFI